MEVLREFCQIYGTIRTGPHSTTVAGIFAVLYSLYVHERICFLGVDLRFPTAHSINPMLEIADSERSDLGIPVKEMEN